MMNRAPSDTFQFGVGRDGRLVSLAETCFFAVTTGLSSGGDRGEITENNYKPHAHHDRNFVLRSEAFK